KDLARPIEGRNVVVVEDVLDQGNTLYTITRMIWAMNPKSVEVVTLLDKPEGRQIDFEADYVGFKVPNEFVVGWGLDYKHKYRDLSFIGVVKNIEEEL
ncbi:MAG: hypoxanthine phosphoribosyltransferase, partial [Parasporobacterium sp.]|nr:hypoxanthine phosphoribosyltransferase [Parasporobacterium sp.]